MTFIRKIVAIMLCMSIGSIHTMGMGRRFLPQWFSLFAVSKVQKPTYIVDNLAHSIQRFNLLPRWQFNNFHFMPKPTAEHKSTIKAHSGVDRDVQSILESMSQQRYTQPSVNQEIYVNQSVLESNSATNTLMARSDSTQTLQDWRGIEHLVPSAEHE